MNDLIDRYSALVAELARNGYHVASVVRSTGKVQESITHFTDANAVNVDEYLAWAKRELDFHVRMVQR